MSLSFVHAVAIMASDKIDWSLTSRTDPRRSSPSHRAWAWRSAGAAMVVGAASIATTFLLLPLAIRAAVRALTLTMDGCVWLATQMSAGVDPLTIASAVGHAAGDTLATGTASSVLLALTAAGALAFYWWQRLLGADGQIPATNAIPAEAPSVSAPGAAAR